VAIAQEKPDNIVESIRFDTTTPDETFGKIKVEYHVPSLDLSGPTLAPSLAFSSLSSILTLPSNFLNLLNY